MTRLGVDPGLHGAWALLDERGRLVTADHFPLDGEGEIDTAALAESWRALAPDAATVEIVGSMGGEKNGRKQGVAGMFNFGRRYGAVLAALDILCIERDGVRPAEWKRASAVTADKGSSLAAARAEWPEAAHLLTRKLDEARAEAALIARYGQRRAAPFRRAA